MIDTAEEIKELLSKDTFISYENCVYLGGACNVGKSTLVASCRGDSTKLEEVYRWINNIFWKEWNKFETMVSLRKGNTTKHYIYTLLNGTSFVTGKKYLFHIFLYTVLYVMSLLVTVFFLVFNGCET